MKAGRRASLQIASGPLSGRVLGRRFTMFDYGVWCTESHFVLYLFIQGSSPPTLVKRLVKCLVTNGSSIDRPTSEVYV